VRFSTRVADAREGSQERDADRTRGKKQKKVAEAQRAYGTDDLPGLVARLEEEMRTAAKNLDFETAARLRDELFDLKAAMGDGAAKGTRGQALSSRSRRCMDLGSRRSDARSMPAPVCHARGRPRERGRPPSCRPSPRDSA
jgi:hypothetical protein